MMLPPGHPLLTPVRLRKELVAEGYDDRAIRRLTRDGALHRVRHGAYVAGERWRGLDPAGRYAVLCRAVQRQAKSRLVLSHVSALPAFEAPLWGLDTSVVHGTRLDERAGRKEAGVQQHSGLLLPGDTDEVDGLAITSAVRTCLDVTMTARADAAVCVVNHFLRAGLVTADELRARYESDATVPRGVDAHASRRSVGMAHWPGSLRTDLVLRIADGRCESVGESRTLHLLAVHGLPRPELQHEVRDGSGRLVARVDFAWPDLGVFLEFDGRIKYGALAPAGESAVDVVLREKRREDRVREATGWLCIRVTSADLADPGRLADRIRAAFSAARAARAGRPA